MTRDLHKATQKLIIDYYSKDKRLTKVILALTLIGVATITLSAVWLYQSRQQLQKQQQAIVELQQEIDRRVQDVQNQINCVGIYFSQPNRGTIIIPDITKCNIKRVR